MSRTLPGKVVEGRSQHSDKPRAVGLGRLQFPAGLEPVVLPPYARTVQIEVHASQGVDELLQQSGCIVFGDVDLLARVIHVYHHLQRTTQMEYIIEEPKTESGIRDIPMTDEVYDCFSRIIAGRPKPKVEPFVGGKTGFLFLDKNGKPKVALHWEKYFHYALEKYNRTYKVQLPKITPHVCRHTFCSNMAKSGMNPKTLQYLIGHSDISITMNTYTHIKFEDARDEVVRMYSEQLAAKNHIQRVKVQAIG